MVKGIVNAKTFDHFMGEKKRDESPIGQHIDSLDRCEGMKDTLSKVVAEKQADETFAEFLTKLCDKANGKRCN